MFLTVAAVITNAHLNLKLNSLKFLQRHKVVTLEALGTCERLAHGRYSAMRRPGVELTTSWLQGQRLNHNTSEWYMFNQFRSGARRHQCWSISRSEGNDHVSRLQDLPVVSATARQYRVAGGYWNVHDILLQAYWLSSQVWWFISLRHFLHCDVLQTRNSVMISRMKSLSVSQRCMLG